jgi:signal transduction histidine kinase
LIEMTLSANQSAIEPLFAHNARLWLRVWAAMQAVALAVACYVVVDGSGGVRPFLAGPAAGRTAAVIALLVVYHLVGLFAHTWMMERPWAVFLFVPLGWAVILAAGATHGAFSVLILGAILQGFIFLSFAWAITALVLVVLLSLWGTLRHDATQEPNLSIARVVGVLAMGITLSTVMLYIHRANRDAAIRSRLLRQLEEAQRDLADRARGAGVQSERQRLARDIHDTLAQGFTSVIKHLEAVELSFDAPCADAADLLRAARPHLTHAQEVSRASLAEIRRLVWALRPPQLVEATLPAAIERIVSQWSDAHGIPATYHLAPLPELHPDAEVIFLRATQESLSNVARHARATRVAVAMHCVDGLVLLSVEDDGRGFADAEAVGAGKMGIEGMRERVQLFGGRVMIESEAGGGTSITIALPLAAIAATPE